MPSGTKETIKSVFLELLNQKSINKISVRAIAEGCGINRNSFYYYFQDIPSLIEEIATETVPALIQKYPSISSLDEAVDAAFQSTLKNKRAFLHIYNSVNRDIYERYLMKICEYVVKTYFETAFSAAKDKISEYDREIMTRFTKCALFGLYIEWINEGMKDDATERLKRLITICHGLSGK